MASAQEVLKRGYLTKSPPQRQALAKWKRRWCMLCDSRLVYPCAPPYVRLEYYEDETAALACKEPKGRRAITPPERKEFYKKEGGGGRE